MGARYYSLDNFASKLDDGELPERESSGFAISDLWDILGALGLVSLKGCLSLHLKEIS